MSDPANNDPDRAAREACACSVPRRKLGAAALFDHNVLVVGGGGAATPLRSPCVVPASAASR